MESVGSIDCMGFLEAIFGRSDGCVCLAFMEDISKPKGKQRFHQRFFRWQQQVAEITAWIEKHRDRDCYVSPVAYSKPQRKKEFALPGHTLYADLDSCEPESLGKYGEPSPSIVVQTSPGRYQAYWLLELDIEPWQYEESNHRIAVGYRDEGCDQTGWPLSKLLRIPGTMNNKHGKPFLVKAELWHGGGDMPLYHPGDFASLPLVPAAVPATHIMFSKEVARVDIQKVEISDRIRRLILNPRTKGERSEADMSVCVALAAAGLTDDEIRAVFEQNPIGAKGKYAEAGDRYLVHTIGKARAWLSEGPTNAAVPKEENDMEDTSKGIRADWRDIKKHLAEEDMPIIDGLLSGGSQAKMLISGVSGFGKTTLGLNLAIPIALGNPVLGRLPVPRRRRVVFVDLERVADAVADQIELLSQTLGEPERGSLDIITGNYKILDKQSMDGLRQKLREGRPEVAIFDSIVNLVNDYNDPVECNLVKEFFQEVLVELNCAVILLHHVATGIDSGSGHLKALGTLGKTLDRWAGTKLAYEGIEGLECYGRLHGVSRSPKWSKIDLLLGYERDTQLLTIVDWDEIPLPQAKKKKVIGPSPRTLEFQQFWILAKRLGYTADDIADMIGVSKATVYRYNSGEDIPSNKTWEAVLEARDKLRGEGGVNEG